MPDVIIKGMEMPESCYSCHLRKRNGMEITCPGLRKSFSVADVNILHYRLKDCPLRTAPDPSTYGGMLRQLNDEELAVWLSEMTKSASLCGLPVSKKHALNWLRRPWEGGAANET